MNETIEKPNPAITTGLRHGVYDKLDDDGLVPPGTRVSGDDILVGKTVALPEDPSGVQRFTRRDASLALRPSEMGVVDQVLLTTNEQGQSFVKVRVRTICIPQVRPLLLCTPFCLGGAERGRRGGVSPASSYQQCYTGIYQCNTSCST